MNSVLAAKRAKLLYFNALRMQLLVLVRRVVAAPASRNGAFKFDKFSHGLLHNLRYDSRTDRMAAFTNGEAAGSVLAPLNWVELRPRTYHTARTG